MGGEPGDHWNAEPAQVIGELVQIGTIDAGIDQDQPPSPRTAMALLQTHALCRTQTPSATRRTDLLDMRVIFMDISMGLLWPVVRGDGGPAWRSLLFA
jgi:hypothetical protein